MYINKSIKILDKIFKIKSGWLAKNTASSLLAEIDGTVLLVTVVYSANESSDFLPLKVEYFERFYASGRIPYNYAKREGKSSDREILIGRLIDRSIRPMFSKNLNFDIQITVTVISINPEINPDIIAINAVSIALYLSCLPFEPVFSFKVLYKDNSLFFNSYLTENKSYDLEMIISGCKDKISMIEGFFNEIDSSILLYCIKESLFNINKVLLSVFDLKTNRKNFILQKKNKYSNLYFLLSKKYAYIFFNLFYFNNYDSDLIQTIKKKIIFLYLTVFDSYSKKNIFFFVLDSFLKFLFRKKILFSNFRLDFRKYNEIRNISISFDNFSRIHGSSIFSRGGTQALVCVTLGSYKDSQLVDCVFFSYYKNNFILHYNFPPYSVNEIGNFSSIKRREIGHGNLAKLALLPIIPKFDDFPYVIRIVSEILSSNGSSSMATVCGSSLALMNTGVPIKCHVAGIAMGLIKEDFFYIILSDISGPEDFFGDMDFKITSTLFGFTSLQMDLKINGINLSIISNIIVQSKVNLNLILRLMYNHIAFPSRNLSNNLNKVKVFKIDKSKIGFVIGKSGSVIKGLMDKYKSDIEITDDGLVRLSSNNFDNINSLFDEINSLIVDFKVGMIFDGKVVKLTQFGAFISLIYKKSGLLHINKINKYRSINPKFLIEEGLIINVKIISIDSDDKIGLDFV